MLKGFMKEGQQVVACQSLDLRQEFEHRSMFSQDKGV